ncbi:UvrD-helicase domain-containing protein [Haloechinothrix sp. LS1_15]|uniref:HelD family protein n=1 Tax=Haloechinothrix sp. LS1_15 TaxID=2652248 RepID=UPI0029444CED|nr:UvrD-helicase domain-containing protein [Haloechinothrix sp. LS1_15]MDV6012857.1 ATP-dependent DNA helicase [Haloechinothrix sp. LS1_15]
MSESWVVRSEIASEQTHVDRVYARVDELRRQAEDMRDRGYELGHGAQREAVFEQASMLFERDVMVSHANHTLHTLDAESEGLVFGRLDTSAGETIHVGRLGIRDGDFDNLVTDWRADAAAPFYQASAEEPMGMIRRRAIQCTGRTVTGIDDDVLMPHAVPQDLRVVGEGALLTALAEARGDHMRDIVRTIQREQDAIIRAPWRGVTEITGGPGTGKTAVALHRAAYLLYRYRKRIGGGGVLVVGPSAAFVGYISRVLPAMGETSVELRALGEVLDGYTACRADQPQLAALKGSVRMRTVLRRAVRDTPPGVPDQLRIVYQGEVLTLDAGQLEAVRGRVLARGAQPNRCRVHAAEALLEALATAAPSHSADGRPIERTRLIAELGERLEFHRFLVTWWPVLRPAEVLRWLGDERRLARAAGRTLDREEVAELAASLACGETGYSPADIALLDEIRALVGRPRRDRQAHRYPADHGEPRRQRRALPEHYDEYSHVIVDEAQDLSPMQWRMIGRRGRSASWTIVGDPAQSSWVSTGKSSGADEVAAARAEALGSQPASRHFTLRTNYRNPAEIFALAATVVTGHADGVDGADLPEAVRRTGIRPRITAVDPASLEGDVRAAAVEMLELVDGTVAVLGAVARVAELDKFLHGVPRDRLTVAGSVDCKGLEYDAVVLVEPGEIVTESPAGRRMLYVATSRATHRLTVLASDPDRWRPA